MSIERPPGTISDANCGAQVATARGVATCTDHGLGHYDPTLDLSWPAGDGQLMTAAAPVPPEVVAAGERVEAAKLAVREMPADWYCPADERRMRITCGECIAEVAAAAAIAADPSPASVDPAEIVRQRSLGWPDFHPEDFCHQCGRPNPTWFADTAEWQTATGSTGDGGGILCPSCFCALWEAKTGKTAIIWRLSIGGGRDAAPRPPSPAEEAVKRVEAVLTELSGYRDGADHRASTRPHNDYDAGMVTAYEAAIDGIRAALASPAPAPQLPQCNLPICPEGDGDHRITTGRCIVAPAPQGERVPWLESISPDSCGHTDREGCTGHGDF